ncbi:MAG: NUDIX domain-containing protein, partial [Actinobacteria bacterium]|nr:NUDIX domain-containing protein [Actinomycetota bacterium]
PPELAGRWELPGGKVEAGESEPAALIRELREELSVEIAVGALLDCTPIRSDLELRVYTALLIDGEPMTGLDHDEVRWVARDQLDELHWLAPDRPAVAVIRLSGLV